MNHPITNPDPKFPFCPDQTDFLCFVAPDGFAAVDMNLVEGFQASTDKGQTLTTIHLTTQTYYISLEPVPVLIARFAATKAKRYALDRAETEIIKTNPIISPPPVQSSAPALSPHVRWKTASENKG